MGKSTDEIASDILCAALAIGQVKTLGSGASGQGSEIGSAYKQISAAVVNPPPPPPAPLSCKAKRKKTKKK